MYISTVSWCLHGPQISSIEEFPSKQFDSLIDYSWLDEYDGPYQCICRVGNSTKINTNVCQIISVIHVIVYEFQLVLLNGTHVTHAILYHLQIEIPSTLTANLIRIAPLI